MAIFSGTVFFLSKKLLPLDTIASLQDVLAQNGAEICHCSDFDRNAPNEFHVIFPDWETFTKLRERRCQVVSPECIFRCAKERVGLPRSYSCCSAMEGTQVVATGYSPEDKANIRAFVESMKGTMTDKVSISTQFVVAKSVLSSQYKLACLLEKPVVSLTWLMHCCREHRIVPHETHRLPCFTGLNICATQLSNDERSKISEAVERNGGCYTPDLSKACTHLVANIAEGRKYVVAMKFRQKVVKPQWIWQSLSRKFCVNEADFPVTRCETEAQPAYLVREPPKSDTPKSSVLVSASAAHSDGHVESDAAQSNCEEKPRLEEAIDDLYLSNCRFYIVGFNKLEKKKLLNMVFAGGGTRFIEFNRTVTHVVMGSPSESELKEVDLGAMWGAMQVVNPSWLEDCSQQRQEIAVSTKHIPARPCSRTEVVHAVRSQSQSALCDANSPGRPETPKISAAFPPKGVFCDISFSFLDSFAINKRSEVINWITQAGGSVQKNCGHFLIGEHGCWNANSNVVSSQWIKTCILENKLLDVNEHIIYRPLACQLPLPGFESFRIHISQYPDKERLPFRNLLYVLGAKFSNIFNKRVTHLICQVAYGEKYQTALALGIRVATMEWMRACVMQNMVLATDEYPPAPAETHSQAARLAGELSSPWTKSADLETPGKRKSSKLLDVQNKRGKSPAQAVDAWDEFAVSWPSGGEGTISKDTRAEEEKHQEESRGASPLNEEKRVANKGDDISASTSKVQEVPEPEPRQSDVAAAIEILLAQTNKRDGSPSKEQDEQREVLAEGTIVSRGGFRQPSSTSPSHLNSKSDGPAVQAHFVESQMESQIVGYDEDHTERRFMMEMVRSGTPVQQKTSTGLLGRLFKAAEANK